MIVQVTTTIDSEEKANFIAEALLKKRMVSCVQIMPVTSRYWWKGKIESTKEYMLVMKGKNSKKIENEIKKIHPYEVPEIIAFPVKKVNKEYKSWVSKEVQ